MVTYLDNVEEYEYNDHEIEIRQEHYSGDKHLTFKAVVDGEHSFTERDYAHAHEGLLGFFTLNFFRRLFSPNYKKKRVKELKQKTENQLDEKIKMKQKAKEMSL